MEIWHVAFEIIIIHSNNKYFLVFDKEISQNNLIAWNNHKKFLINEMYFQVNRKSVILLYLK